MFSNFLSISMAVEPPFFEKYKAILQSSAEMEKFPMVEVCEEIELPLIDLSGLNLGPFERQKCIEQMAEASSEWGFFQIVNHGIPEELLDRLKSEQMKVFHRPFDKKAGKNFLNLSAQSYRWGNPLATSLRNLSWSEALHISLKDVSRMDESNKLSYRCCFMKLALCYHPPAKHFQNPQRLSQPWPGVPSATRPLPLWLSPQRAFASEAKAACALSNGMYESITHRVVANQEVERYSMAYFYCPTYETVIESCSKPALYRNFNFKEYREQIGKDVKATGDKVGLSRFLL
ncbi:hypothetical protein QUC31_001878 [Theobroma cacao]